MSKKKGEGLKSFNKGFSSGHLHYYFLCGCPCCDRYVLCSEGLLRNTGCYVHDERGGEDPYGN